MTKIDFYIIEKGSEEATDTFICRLTGKAWAQNNAVYMHTIDQAHASKYDELLWTFSETSFVPHQLATAKATAYLDKTVLIDHNNAANVSHHHDVLINLNHAAPSFFSQFDRVAEIITTDETSKVKGRERYQFYRDRGYELVTHKIAL
ncbi:MAG: DNA polymerase III subunit chi [Woeseiaceae bacterium]